MGKTYAGTFLYNKYGEYENAIFAFIMGGTEIDKDAPQFADIVYDVKRRQINNSLVKILMSDKIVLMTNEKPLDRAFKVICAKDIKGPKKNAKKIFIDCTGIIGKDETGKYSCSNVDILIAYLVSAMINYIYYIDENRILGNAKVAKIGAEAFSSLFTHIVDYVCKISTMSTARAKCVYLSSLYYLSNIMDKDVNMENVYTIAMNLAGFSKREADIINIQLNKNSFDNIKTFVETVSDILKISKFTLDVLIEKWMFVYGVGTVFSLEMFPAFSAMLTDTYVGCYLNNQKTIEKVASKSMVEFTKVLLQIGSESV